jgi:hypothetical protein
MINHLQNNTIKGAIIMKVSLHLLLVACLTAISAAQASSTASINATISFTLTDIQVGGMSAEADFDYENDGGTEASGSFEEVFIFGGTGTTSGSSSGSLNGTTIDPMLDGDPLAVGDTFALTSSSQSTSNTGAGVQRNQFSNISFGFLNFTDDGVGGNDTLSFLFDYSLSYTTSLTNDVAGDGAFAEFEMLITTFDDGLPTIEALNLFPQSTPSQIFEGNFGAGTTMPADGRSGSFELQLTESGFFDFTSKGIAVTNINTVPVPAAVWLFGSGLLGLVGAARRKA